MSALLFEHRLKVIGGVVVVALMLAVASAKLPLEHAALMPLVKLMPAWRAPIFGVTGALCWVAFALRVLGEARLGAAVWQQGQTPQLVDQGVFARARNPLYLGTWLFFTALILLWAPVIVAIALSVLFFAALRAMVLHEEQLLSKTLGAPYVDYLARVPRWGWRISSSSAATAPPEGAAVMRSVLPNLGLFSFGLFRVGVALGGPEKLLGLVNIACVLVWVAAVLVRRARGLSPS